MRDVSIYAKCFEFAVAKDFYCLHSADQLPPQFKVLGVVCHIGERNRSGISSLGINGPTRYPANFLSPEGIVFWGAIWTWWLESGISFSRERDVSYYIYAFAE